MLLIQLVLIIIKVSTLQSLFKAFLKPAALHSALFQIKFVSNNRYCHSIHEKKRRARVNNVENYPHARERAFSPTLLEELTFSVRFSGM